VENFTKAAENGAQIIAFAELAFTPFYPQVRAGSDLHDLAETIPGPLTEVFSGLSKKYGVVAILNLFEKEGTKTYDSSPVIDADGSITGVTRMVHILQAPNFYEQDYYNPGDSQMVFDTSFGKIGVAICYDRHFPEYMRTLGIRGAELVIVPQAGSVGEWPQGLYEAELKVAGFQNGYFTALCNRVGKEENLTFEGKSFINGPDGRLIAQAPAMEDAVLYAEIDLDEVKECHARRHFLNDRRPELYSDWLC